jgi:diguanylate cyclase (GGDEF)-like protein/PAS domain S-box-containing protein
MPLWRNPGPENTFVMSDDNKNRGGKILVVDDDSTALLLMRAALRKSGFEATMASSGAEALRLFRADAFDVVMLDVSMPEMSGYEVCVALRKEADTSLPIVMVTGMDDVDSVELAYQSGATDFISKPINWALIGHRARYLMRGHQALKQLHTANVRNDAILQAIPDFLFEIDIDGQFLSANSPRDSVLSARAESLAGKMLGDVFPADVGKIFMEALGEAMEQEKSIGRQFQLTRDDGSFWFELSVALKEQVAGQNAQFIGLARDITQRKADEQKILRLAMFDNLTGLPNRQSFIDRIDREIKRSQLSGTSFAVLFMDLDGFKNINDTMGHSAGDLALQWAAGRLREGVRPTDLVSRMQSVPPELAIARLGGDEFTALIVDIAHPEDVDQIADRILGMMRSPFMLLGREMRLSTSIGVAIFRDDGEDAATLLRNADTAMYHAKSAGRDNYKFYNRTLTEQVLHRMALERDLHAALEGKEFSLNYQPLLDVATGKITGVEALIRWIRPGFGPVGPDDFIGAAERTGLIVPMGEWVLRTACENAARWLNAGYDVRVAVNLSPLQFKDPKLVQMVMDALEDTKLPPHRLELELTESAVMQDNAANTLTLKSFHDSGVRVALDDFGTGHSSLSYLKRMPLSRLKIDQSFVVGLPEDVENLAIVKAIVAMAESLSLNVTAEGVETLQQASVLKEMGCQSLQGYYFGKPMPAAEMDILLAKNALRLKPVAKAPDHPSLTPVA